MCRLLGIRSPILDHLPRILGTLLCVPLETLLAPAALASPQAGLEARLITGDYT